MRGPSPTVAPDLIRGPAFLIRRRKAAGPRIKSGVTSN